MKALYKVWRNPRAAVREVEASGRGVPFVPLAGIYGAAHNLNKVLTRGVDPSQGGNSLQVLGITLVIGFLYGASLLHALSYPLSWFGRRLGGVASPQSVRNVLGLAAVPFVPLLFAAVVLTLLGPSTLLVRSEGSLFTGIGGTVWGPATVLYLALWGVLSAWLCVIGVVGLSEVHAFTVRRSIATYACVGLGFVVLLVTIVAIFVKATPST